MERIGPVRRIQGGGCGEGFKTPRAISRSENPRFKLIVRRMIENGKDHGLKGTCGENIAEDKNRRHEIFLRELQERCFTLQQRKVTGQEIGEVSGINLND